MNEQFSESELQFWRWLDTNPLLRELRAVKMRDIMALEEYATSNLPGSGLKALCRFVLSVWSEHGWECGRFDVFDLGSMDPGNRAWCAAWFREPWWP